MIPSEGPGPRLLASRERKMKVSDGGGRGHGGGQSVYGRCVPSIWQSVAEPRWASGHCRWV